MPRPPRAGTPRNVENGPFLSLFCKRILQKREEVPRFRETRHLNEPVAVARETGGAATLSAEGCGAGARSPFLRDTPSWLLHIFLSWHSLCYLTGRYATGFSSKSADKAI
jgi:hypothetical protein